MATPTRPTDQDPDWADQLADHLGPGCFPATHDRLVAILSTRHAPSHLLWRLAALPRAREFSSLAELLEHLGQTDGPSGPRTSTDPS
ncbi:hypothetical protein BJ986_000298 [Phycicoccus badiiscoriae]|uniref:DUF2795 domain-containing protein n=1 Tax=Pedococcus badiiscoriae TaxID=642776 RepID=A0A852WEH0_9MICO|nr:DUF2795 domain-containing protein [Pedococcus badiiscoriae]NYG05811.1 hypothetical protein [Pedococcus badiiscoriae]